MTFKVVRDRVAQSDIEDFGRYAANYSEDFAREQFVRLNRIFAVDLAEAPNTWNYFYVTGAPYRAYLFRVGRRTNYWIIYSVDDEAKVVRVLRFWNASREPASFEI
jgi:mRNA-degrading endonuclease RelE of RelBE toxin-antitoxin system